ncbi:MAG: hypothetical protein OJF59_002408 [Cytophagales bacterium]|nr:MAG: hypothetical protein OJF59_002408 [Cytophagales bacterium]
MDDKPPLFNSWKTWYQLVMGALIIQVIIYFLITKSYS